ncbi:FG-GAP repeat domain-containing protein [Salinispora mooreana]|uniref:FG-GAP repeat domain-containing protein n=1 Tax=Salinispora mooreana TaxID=999545 RepID=UPI0004B14B63|nr:VCBS repeat-containing protein [Salinispora mooreana]
MTTASPTATPPPDKSAKAGTPSTPSSAPTSTGDGYTDLVARKPDGTLWLYSNNIERDNGVPYSYASSRQIGQSWDAFDTIIGADVTGDGYTDLVARKPDGTLWLYSNNIVRDNGVPYSYASSRQIGQSWDVFDTII